MLSNENKSLDTFHEDNQEEILLASVGNRVWNDFDKDGIKGVCDKGVAGVKITLYNVKDNTPTDYTETTDINGEYLIENIEPGEYYAVFDPGFDYEFITEGGWVDSLGRSRDFVLEEGEVNLTINAPVIKNIGCIKGNIFKDIKINNLNNEIMYSGKEIILLNETGYREKKITNELGRYSFERLVDGKYTLIFQDDIDYKCITSKAVEVKLQNGEKYSYINAVFEKINSEYFIQGRVFLERISTGTLKLKDTLVNGIIVEIYKDNKLINSCLTQTINGLMGVYRFENLEGGNYTIKFVLPEGVSFGNQKNIPYGSKVDVETGEAEVLIDNTSIIDVNAAIIISKL